MDIAIFAIGGTIGLGIGLVCRHNGIRVFPNYYRDVNMGVIGKSYYNHTQIEYEKERKREANNQIPYGTRHYNHPTK